VDNQFVTEHTLKGPDVLCRYWYDNPPSDDAHLIAAAPDLLTALEGLFDLNCISYCDYETEKVEAAEQARAAIAKARNQ
jgi:hypothetical protein